MLFDEENFDNEADAGLDSVLPSGLVLPREMADLFGHEESEKSLLALFSGDRPPHALIFSGPEGIGKSTLAFRLARHLLGIGESVSSGPGLFGDLLPSTLSGGLYIAADNPVFRQVAAGGHPDLLTIERPFDEKKSVRKDGIPVEEARRAAPFLRMTAGKGGWRIVIIDDADTMNRNAQNAILKILEEPPPRALLILVAHRAGALLPTIRSRCRLFSLRPLKQDVFTDLLRRDYPDLSSKDSEILHQLTGGSIGQSLRLLKEGGIEAMGRVTGLLASWPRWNWPEIHGLADALSRSEQDNSSRIFREIFLWTVETMAKARATGRSLPSPLDKGAFASFLEFYTLAEWVEICEKAGGHFETADRSHLDRKQTILGAFMIFDRKEAA